MLTFFVVALLHVFAAPARILHFGKQRLIVGINAPGIIYAGDFGDKDAYNREATPADFQNLLQTVKKNGGNTVRWFIHCDGRGGLNWNGSQVTGLHSTFFTDFDALVNAAKTNDVYLIPVLWDFQLGKDGNRFKIVKDPSSYITKALEPIIKRYRNEETILAWEIMNEPEWMVDGTEGVTTPNRVTWPEMYGFVNKLSAAIKHIDSTAKVTVGSAGFKWSSRGIAGTANFWQDRYLVGTTGDSLGVLDFYQVHYYDWLGKSPNNYSPFQHAANFWKDAQDKPLLIGEYPAIGNDGQTQAKCLALLADSGYAGALSWAYTSSNFWRSGDDVSTHGSWSDMAPALKAFQSSHAKMVDLDIGGPSTDDSLVLDEFEAQPWTWRVTAGSAALVAKRSGTAGMLGSRSLELDVAGLSNTKTVSLTRSMVVPASKWRYLYAFARWNDASTPKTILASVQMQYGTAHTLKQGSLTSISDTGWQPIVLDLGSLPKSATDSVVRIGIALSSDASTITGTARVDNFRLSNTPPPKPIPSGLSGGKPDQQALRLEGAWIHFPAASYQRVLICSRANGTQISATPIPAGVRSAPAPSAHGLVLVTLSGEQNRFWARFARMN